MVKNGIRKSAGEKIFDAVNYAFLCLFCVAILIPMFYIIVKSLSPIEIYMQGKFFVPLNRITLESYRYIFATPIIPRAYGVTIFVTVVGTIMNLIVTGLAAYALSRKILPGKKIFMSLVLIIMYFNGGLIPTFIVVKSYGLINSLWALILIGLLNPWYMIIMRSFFYQIPEEIEEAATIDGCSSFGVFFKIVLPLSKAAFASIGLFYAVIHWNSFFNCVIYILDQSKWTLQVVLRQIVISDDMASLAIESLDLPPMETVKYAAILVTTIPIICLYPFLQKHFVKGVMLGGVKG